MLTRVQRLLLLGRPFIALVGAFTVFRVLKVTLLASRERGDLDILLLAGERFLARKPLYLLSDSSEHTKPPLLSPLLAALAALPRSWVHAAWDILLLLAPFLLLSLWNRLRSEEGKARIPLLWEGLLGCVLLGPLWTVEAAYGQYNLLQLLLLLGSLLLLRRNFGHRGPFTAGLLLVPGVLLKPTLVLFGPWILGRWATAGRKSLAFPLGIAGAALLLIAGFLWLQPSASLLQEHAEWAHFIGQSQARHLLRSDNFGFPTLLARLGSDFVRGPGIMAVSLLLASGITGLHHFSPRRFTPLQTFLAIHLLTLVSSPMAWRQNFVLLLPLAWELAILRPKNRVSRGFLAAAFLALLLIGRVSDHWFPTAFNDLWQQATIPSFLAVLTYVLWWRILRAETAPGINSP
jgi:hypothetical protein